MNDFTKEELKKILSWADMYTEFGTSWVTKAQMPLIDKIQSMIDNYSKNIWCPNPNCRLSIHPSNVECMK
jgi:hypothetical protein